MINEYPNEKCSLILVAAWNKFGLRYIQTETIKAIEYSRFLLILNWFLANSEIGKQNDLVMTLENTRTHKAAISVDIQYKIALKTLFLASYYPEVVPVERIFGFVKTGMKGKLSYSFLDLNKESESEKIFDIL